MVIARAKPVLHYERRDAHGIQKVRHLPAFVIASKKSVAAAGKNDHGRRRRMSRIWRMSCPRGIQRKRRLVGISVAQRARRFACPERHGDRFRGRILSLLRWRSCLLYGQRNCEKQTGQKKNGYQRNCHKRSRFHQTLSVEYFIALPAAGGPYSQERG